MSLVSSSPIDEAKMPSLSWLTETAPEVGHDLPGQPQKGLMSLTVSQELLPGQGASFTVSGVPTHHLPFVLTSRTWHSVCDTRARVL